MRVVQITQQQHRFEASFVQCGCHEMQPVDVTKAGTQFPSQGNAANSNPAAHRAPLVCGYRSTPSFFIWVTSAWAKLATGALKSENRDAFEGI